MRCEVKNCSHESTTTLLGISLCDKHFGEHCDGKDLDTKKGLITFCSGATVVLDNKRRKD